MGRGGERLQQNGGTGFPRREAAEAADVGGLAYFSAQRPPHNTSEQPLPGRQFVIVPAAYGGTWLIPDQMRGGCMASGCGWFKAKGRKGRKLRQEVGTSPLCLPGSGYKGFWVCIPRCSWLSKPSGGESAGVENDQKLL